MAERSPAPSTPGIAGAIAIRAATSADREAIWSILEPTIRLGETYPLPRNLGCDDALAFWCAPGHETFVADIDGRTVGTYFLRENQAGGGSHVANCGYVTGPHAEGRGVGRAMLEHSLARAKARGFRAMQFNFVVSSNERAVRTWQAYGFQIVGRLPQAFAHPRLGFVDALVMFKVL
jgi:ribosomal protein S18 acetylase RimI-like enzyme